MMHLKRFPLILVVSFFTKKFSSHNQQTSFQLISITYYYKPSECTFVLPHFEPEKLAVYSTPQAIKQAIDLSGEFFQKNRSRATPIQSNCVGMFACLQTRVHVSLVVFPAVRPNELALLFIKAARMQEKKRSKNQHSLTSQVSPRNTCSPLLGMHQSLAMDIMLTLTIDEGFNCLQM